MRFRKERFFDYPVDKVTSLFMENGGGYDMQELENVKGWKVLKEDDRGDSRIGAKEWCAHGRIPKALQHIISPKMLSWIEHSEWNRRDKIYKFEIEPFYFRKQITCRGKTVFAAAGENRSSRTFEVELKVDIPVFGAMIEGLVMEYLKKNEDQDYRLCLKHLQAAYGRQG